ncbi:hypothetical protein [Pseudomonas syringae]|uniref:Uncharacterized protein n=1 Tax=Pseudomonas syringae pv. syringae (strain B728a) TaxID=205918 RepID=Q4ZSM9_PSEU2|nr:hypothetical protein [Pseudomonas syringae]AAY37843.1 hypothetical protein Psyr_2804 [Pseudomonas syringae pv. syringae B728a]PYD18392.1 hypothetical protein DND47_04430 [Pseudomonas syringae pv. syringae]
MDNRNKSGLDDIKTLFDGVKNLALCAALAVGLKEFQAPMENLGMSYQARQMINTSGMLVASGFTTLAIVWLCFSFKEKPAWPIMFRLSLIALGTVTLIVMAIIIASATESIPSFFLFL